MDPTKKQKTETNLKDPIVWVDLEMSGLDIENGDQILEIAVILTDGSLETIIEGPEIIVKTEKQVLDNMNDWCKEHHGKSGLTQKCLESTITIQEAENEVMKFLTDNNIWSKDAILGGNSVYMDRLFIRKFMSNFDNYLHYRILDVSSVKEICRRWYPEQFKSQPKKKLSHRALDDIVESIEELKFYRKSIFIQQQQEQQQK